MQSVDPPAGSAPEICRFSLPSPVTVGGGSAAPSSVTAMLWRWVRDPVQARALSPERGARGGGGMGQRQARRLSLRGRARPRRRPKPGAAAVCAARGPKATGRGAALPRGAPVPDPSRPPTPQRQLHALQLCARRQAARVGGVAGGLGRQLEARPVGVGPCRVEAELEVGLRRESGGAARGAGCSMGSAARAVVWSGVGRAGRRRGPGLAARCCDGGRALHRAAAGNAGPPAVLPGPAPRQLRLPHSRRRQLLSSPQGHQRNAHPAAPAAGGGAPLVPWGGRGRRRGRSRARRAQAWAWLSGSGQRVCIRVPRPADTRGAGRAARDWFGPDSGRWLEVVSRAVAHG
jgi:hypothetical protein